MFLSQEGTLLDRLSVNTELKHLLNNADLSHPRVSNLAFRCTLQQVSKAPLHLHNLPGQTLSLRLLMTSDQAGQLNAH